MTEKEKLKARINLLTKKYQKLCNNTWPDYVIEDYEQPGFTLIVKYDEPVFTFHSSDVNKYVQLKFTEEQIKRLCIELINRAF